MFEVSEIKSIRKKLGLTQGQLAKLAGVSQSLIAKIEAGLIDPAFSKAKQIFTAIDTLSNKKNVKVESIIVKRIISLSPNETLKSAIEKMKKYEISQAPVIDGQSVVGLISESILLDALISTNNPNMKVCDVMSEAPPIVSTSADIDAASYLLKYYPLVLVSNKGKYVGILTKSDLIRTMLRK
jgi:predicted transcriptional regulator